METTLQQLERLFDDKLQPIHTKLDAIAETQSTHSNTLDRLGQADQGLERGNDGFAESDGALRERA